MKTLSTIVVTSLLLVFVLNADAATEYQWEITQITNNLWVDDYAPSVYGNDICWISSKQLMLLMGEQTYTIVSSYYDQGGKDVYAQNDNTVFFWYDKYVSLKAYDKNSHQTQMLNPTGSGISYVGDISACPNQMVFSAFANLNNPQIVHFNGDYFTEITAREAGHIVSSPVVSEQWIAYLVGNPAQSIRVYDWDTEETITSIATGAFTFLHASDTHIYWYGNSELSRWDGSSTEIIIEPFYGSSISGFQDYLVWSYNVNSISQIFFWDGDTITQVTDMPWRCDEPSIYVDDEKINIVFKCQYGGSPNDFELYLATHYKTPRDFTPNINQAVEISWPSIYGKLYQVEYTDSLDSPTWSQLSGTLVGTGDNIQWYDADIGAPTQRYYRVIEY